MSEPQAKESFSLNDGNWFPVFRQIRNNWTWDDKPFNRGCALVDLLARANYRVSKMPFRGAILTVNPKEIACTYDGLSKDWGWSRNKTRGFIKALIDDGTLTGVWRSIDAKTNGWTDRKTDSGILVLTVTKMPINGFSQIAKTGEATGEKTGGGQETDRKRTHPRSKDREEGKDKGSPEARVLAVEIVSNWNEGRPPEAHIRVTDRRISHVNARLADGFTREQILTACRNLKASPWHQGQNDRGWKARGPEWAIDSIEKAEEWVNKNHGTTKEKADYGPPRLN